MTHNKKDVSVNGTVILLLVIVSAIFLQTASIHNDDWYWGLLITLPLLFTVIADVNRSGKV